jgi:hypothetical protein
VRARLGDLGLDRHVQDVREPNLLSVDPVREPPEQHRQVSRGRTVLGVRQGEVTTGSLGHARDHAAGAVSPRMGRSGPFQSPHQPVADPPSGPRQTTCRHQRARCRSRPTSPPAAICPWPWRWAAALYSAWIPASGRPSVGAPGGEAAGSRPGPHFRRMLLGDARERSTASSGRCRAEPGHGRSGVPVRTACTTSRMPCAAAAAACSSCSRSMCEAPPTVRCALSGDSAASAS